MAEETSTATTEVTTTETTELGDAGKAALQAERQRASTEERARKAAERERDALKAEIDKHREATQSESEKAIAKARQEAANEATAAVSARYNAALVASAIRARAAGQFADPDDAVLNLQSRMDDFTVGDDLTVDAKALDTALADVLKNKPHLAAGDTRRFQGGADNGTRQTDTSTTTTDWLTPAPR